MVVLAQEVVIKQSDGILGQACEPLIAHNGFLACK